MGMYGFEFKIEKHSEFKIEKHLLYDEENKKIFVN